jgi:hypothetical protein
MLALPKGQKTSSEADYADRDEVLKGKLEGRSNTVDPWREVNTGA